MDASTGEVAIVTGAAGGMGSAIAHALARAGWALVLCDLHAGTSRRWPAGSAVWFA